MYIHRYIYHQYTTVFSPHRRGDGWRAHGTTIKQNPTLKQLITIFRAHVRGKKKPYFRMSNVPVQQQPQISKVYYKVHDII